MKVSENKYVEFHETHWTDYLNNELRKVDEHGLSLGDHRCYKVIDKNDESIEYVLFNGKGEPVAIEDDPYNMEVFILAYRMKFHEKLDIRNMSQTKEVPRVM